jgi:hypothetical protein
MEVVDGDLIVSPAAQNLQRAVSVVCSRCGMLSDLDSNVYYYFIKIKTFGGGWSRQFENIDAMRQHRA